MEDWLNKTDGHLLNFALGMSCEYSQIRSGQGDGLERVPICTPIRAALPWSYPFWVLKGPGSQRAHSGLFATHTSQPFSSFLQSAIFFVTLQSLERLRLLLQGLRNSWLLLHSDAIQEFPCYFFNSVVFSCHSPALFHKIEPIHYLTVSLKNKIQKMLYGLIIFLASPEFLSAWNTHSSLWILILVAKLCKFIEMIVLS